MNVITDRSVGTMAMSPLPHSLLQGMCPGFKYYYIGFYTSSTQIFALAEALQVGKGNPYPKFMFG